MHCKSNAYFPCKLQYNLLSNRNARCGMGKFQIPRVPGDNKQDHPVSKRCYRTGGVGDSRHRLYFFGLRHSSRKGRPGGAPRKRIRGDAVRRPLFLRSLQPKMRPPERGPRVGGMAVGSMPGAGVMASSPAGSAAAAIAGAAARSAFFIVSYFPERQHHRREDDQPHEQRRPVLSYPFKHLP